eukprot:8209268-Alexandrium_andersonii.AAC.1
MPKQLRLAPRSSLGLIPRRIARRLRRCKTWLRAFGAGAARDQDRPRHWSAKLWRRLDHR